MFTGIIETVGIVSSIEVQKTNVDFWIESSISDQLKIDQSVSHNGVCLTVTELRANRHRVTAIDETLKKSNLGVLKKGSRVNLERCMLNNGRFDGHIVQGHVDQIGTVKKITDENGSWLFVFEYDPLPGNVTVEKGSIAINGVSLTCFNSTERTFAVAVIPYTFENTSFNELKEGDSVNLEFDIIGKYVKRLLAQR
jgi:riboflavin synthase